MRVTKLALGPMDNNVYIVTCTRTGESAVIDASYDAQRIVSALAGTTVRYILLTHSDADHIDALPELKAATGAPVGVHGADAGNLAVAPDFVIADEQVISFGDVALRALHTSGHTAGSLCFYGEETLFSGDTLFPGGPGATQGDHERFALIIESIMSKLFTLPDTTVVRPGHGADTTIGMEKPHLHEWIDRGW